MILQRPRHEDRAADFQVCDEQHLDTMHGVTKAAYWGGIVASTVVPGIGGAVGMFVAFVAGTLSESTTRDMAARDARRASVSGGDLMLSEGEKKQRALLTFSERFLPLVFLRK